MPIPLEHIRNRVDNSCLALAKILLLPLTAYNTIDGLPWQPTSISDALTKGLVKQNKNFCTI
jgi:hypothetical protein